MWRRFTFFDKRPLEPSLELSRLSLSCSAAGVGPYGVLLCLFGSDSGVLEIVFVTNENFKTRNILNRYENTFEFKKNLKRSQNL